MRAPDLTRNTPRNFWPYVLAVTAALVWIWVFVVLEFTEPGLLRFMAAGAFLILAGLAYGPSTLDMTGWTLATMYMFGLGLVVLVGSPLVYALWVAFVGPHVEVTFK